MNTEAFSQAFLIAVHQIPFQRMQSNKRATAMRLKLAEIVLLKDDGEKRWAQQVRTD